jgi:FeS assembly SUF system protein
MWKLFEQAFGVRNAESGIRDSGLGTITESASNAAETGSMGQSAGKTPETAGSEPQPAAATPAPAGPAQPAVAVSVLEGQVKDALRTVYDPEIPINIQELGLVYDLRVEPTGQVYVQMTLTAPSCPEAQFIPGRVEQAIREVPGVTDVKVDLVWEPPWTPQKMSEAARLQLGIF